MAPRHADKPSIRDYITAHWKVIIGLVALIAVQLVGSDTADWIFVVLGTLGIGGVPNDQGAKARIYPRSR
jgi:hypothetical protein